jgi:Fe-S oxidoreductase/nitrate reductase gamma subunit
MDITRQIFWNINGKGFLYVAALVAFLIFSLGINNRIRGWKQGQAGNNSRPQNMSVKVINMFLHDENIFKTPVRRFMHLGIFYGLFILLIGSIVIALQEYIGIHFFYGSFYLILSLFLDLFGLLAIISIVMTASKKYGNKLDNKTKTIDDAISLTLLFVILLTGFILEGLRIFAAGDMWAQWSPVGLTIAIIAQKSGLSIGSARSIHAGLWYFHMLVSLGFIAYIPYSKLFHMVASPLNILFKSYSSIGALTPVGIIPEHTGNLGAARLEHFTRKQLMELDACLSCVRCEKHCPAYESGAPFSPRLLLQALKKHARQKYSFFGKSRKSFDSHFIGTVISKEALLSCTTCGLCEVKCPVNAEHVNRIIDMRRSFMSEVNAYPNDFRELFENLFNKGNPWGVSPSSITDLGAPLISEKENTDILYWAGCFGAYDSRNNQVTQAMINILNQAGADFAVMGGEGKCCGDNARRLGNELLFQQLAKSNIKSLNNYKFNTIVTACPHCYNTLKNEYPEFGGSYSVLHHSEFILQLIESGKIKPKAAEKRKITYHDPCYLGRYNNIFSAPREVLASIPGVELAEMKSAESKSNCCGAGGGQIWQKDKRSIKMGSFRAQEAVNIEPDIVASACPLCLISLTDAVCSLEPGIKNMDIAEIIFENISN